MSFWRSSAPEKGLSARGVPNRTRSAAAQRAAAERGFRLRLEASQRLELLAEHFLAVDAEPAVEDGGVHLAEVAGVLQVAHLVVGQARVLADHARLDLAADQEHRRRGAVVGA